MRQQVIKQLELYFHTMPDDDIGVWHASTVKRDDAKMILKAIGFWLNESGLDDEAPEVLQIIEQEADAVIQSEVEQRILSEQSIQHERSLSGWI